MIDTFFRPFLGGIFFDAGLQTSSRLLLYVLCMLASGEGFSTTQSVGSGVLGDGVHTPKCMGGGE